MKKFLTVLLALSVVFTYSFSAVGSVFAASTSEDEYNVLVEQAAAQVKATTTTAYTEAVKVLEDADPGLGTAANVDAAIWQANASIYGAKIDKLIADKTADIKALYTSDKSTVEALDVNGIVALFTIAKGSNYTGTSTSAQADAVPATVTDVKTAIVADADVKLAVAKAYGKSLADDAVVALKNIDTSVYSNTVNTTTNMSSVAMATALINKAVADIQAMDFAGAEAITGVDTLITKLGKFQEGTYTAITGEVTEGTAGSGILKDFVEAKDATYNVTKYVISSSAKYEEQELVTKDDEKADADKLAAKKASYLAAVQAEYAAYISANTTAADKEEAEAYKAGVTEIINSAKTIADLEAIFANEAAVTKQKPVKGTSKYAEDKEAISALEVLANKYIADGYDAEDINEIVAGAKVQAYKLAAAWNGTWNGTKNAEEAIKEAVAKQFDTKKIDKEVAELEIALEKLIKEDATPGYYAPEATQVKALYQTIIAEIKACASDDDITKVKTKYNGTSNWDDPKGLSDILNKTQVQDAIKKTATEWTNNKSAISLYGQSLNVGLDATKDGYRDFVKAGMFDSATAVKEAWLVDFYAEKGARTTAEATAMISQAKAALDAVMTKAAAETAADAIEAQIAALPAATAITAADAAAVEAVKETYDNFVKETGFDISSTSKLILNNAIKAAGWASNLVLSQEINSYVGKTVTSADKAALENLLERANAFNAKTDAGKIYNGITKVTITTVQTKLAEIRNAAKKEVEKAIAALPLTVTKDNVEQVNAAKKLYDEYVSTYTDFYTAVDDMYGAGSGFKQDASADFSASTMADFKAALKAADKVNAEIEAAEKEEIIAAVESLKITASSTAAKGSITVKWKVVGDYDAADGMRVYKSTKKNSGYGATPYFITKKGAMQYKNTKELKKGTRYYYKVRAYVEIDGVKYYSDWSNKAYRIAK